MNQTIKYKKMIPFYFKEILKSISHTKLSFIFSLITTCVSIVLIVASIVLVKSSRSLEGSIKEKLTMTLFLNEADSSDGFQKIRDKLASLSYIKSSQYLDKNQASQRFIEDTGEDFRSVLDYNPLPASIEVVIKPEYINKNSVQRIAVELKNIEGVEDVVFQSEAFFKVLEILSSIKVYVFLSAFFLIIVSFYIVFSTNKLIINSRKAEIETMKLVGAKRSTIKLPIILNGMIIGIIASIMSCLFIRCAILLLKSYLGITFFENEFYFIYLFTLICGPVIGLFASLFSVQKITLRLS